MTQKQDHNSCQREKNTQKEDMRLTERSLGVIKVIKTLFSVLLEEAKREASKY